MSEPTNVTVDFFGMLSSYATAEMIYAADVAGVWDAFAAAGNGQLQLVEFIQHRQLAPRYVHAIIDYLVRVGLLNRLDSKSDSIELSPAGLDLVKKDCFGHFALVVGAYGSVLHSAGELATGKKRYGIDIRRDPTILAKASTRIGQSKLHSSYRVMLEHANQDEDCIVDVGCGAGDFLSVLAERTHSRRIVGIDVLPEACDLARARLSSVGGKAELICADIANVGDQLNGYRGCAGLVTALFVVHELIGKKPGIETALGTLRALLKPDGRLLLLEKATDILSEVRHPPYFSEFKLLHDLTDQNLTDRKHWRELLNAAGFVIRQERALAPHTGSVLFECALNT